MATEWSNHCKYMVAKKHVDFESDSIKVILMDATYTWNKDTDATYADISAHELATGFGYTQNATTLANAVITEDDTNDRMECVYDDVTWAASGGNIGPTVGAIFYDDTTSDDTIVGFLDFGSAQTAADGSNLVIQNIKIQIN